jgi:hypothetical protein
MLLFYLGVNRLQITVSSPLSGMMFTPNENWNIMPFKMLKSNIDLNMAESADDH